MNIGWHDICLKSENLAASKAFYQALGMDVLHDSDQWVHLSNGNTHISLMTFLAENWINFRGADVNAVHAALASQGIAAEGAPEAYSTEGSGTHWNTRDPEGNVIYFDTAADEAPRSKQVALLLTDLERYMAKAGIVSTTFAAFKEELEAKYPSES